jgi:hypothetical protein
MALLHSLLLKTGSIFFFRKDSSPKAEGANFLRDVIAESEN